MANEERVLANESKMDEANSPKIDEANSPEFSKVKLLQRIGLLCRKYNAVTGEFEPSWPLRLVAFFSLLSKFLLAFKLVFSYFFPRSHIIQLYFGSVFNYLPDQAKFMMAAEGVICGFWAMSFHLVFNRLNGRHDYRLFKFWMKLTHELPAKNDYRMAGLSVEANKKFWSNENSFNHLWGRVIGWYTVFLSLVFSSQLFFVKFEGVEILSPTYILVQSLHVIQTIHGVFSWVHCLYTLNLFYVTCMRFFAKRFRFIGRQLEKMSSSRAVGRTENRKFFKLITEHHQVHHDLMLINEMFKFQTGFNLIAFFAMGITAAYLLLLAIDWRLKLAIFTLIFFLYLTVICLPFIMANSVENEFNKAMHEFENLAFHRSVNRAIKQKIDLISQLTETAGFTCFDWFLLDPSTALHFSLEFVAYLFLMITTYYYL